MTVGEPGAVAVRRSTQVLADELVVEVALLGLLGDDALRSVKRQDCTALSAAHELVSDERSSLAAKVGLPWQEPSAQLGVKTSR
jgi:hypothetical protein